MDSFIGFAGIGTAVIASMGLAMWMEWYCLCWLMRLMPEQARAAQKNTTALHPSEEAEFTVIEPEEAEVEMARAAPAKVTRHEIRPGI
jgi:hypothetical protein